MNVGQCDDSDRLRGALVGAALGEILARSGNGTDAPDVATLERRLRADRWPLGPGMQAALEVGDQVAQADLGSLPPPRHLHGTGDELNLLPVLPVALTGAFRPNVIRQRAAALFAHAPPETAEAAIAFALLVAALFDGDRLTALDEAAEAAPAAVGMAMRSAPLEDADRVIARQEPTRSLVAGVWSFYQADGVVEALLIAARTGAGGVCGGVSGALAGTWWGLRGIPKELAGKVADPGPITLGERLARLLAGATNR